MATTEGDDDEERRKQFSIYLEKHGVEKKLESVLVNLFNQDPWPEKPIHFIRRHLGAPDGTSMQELQEQNDDLRFKNEELEATIDALMNQLESFERDTESL
jgi:hypothetical protein